MEFSENTKDIGEDFSSAIRAAGYSPMIIRDKDHNNQIVPCKLVVSEIICLYEINMALYDSL